MNEYAVADLIYHLQNNPKSIMPDWCYASRDALGEILDLSEKSIREIIKKLESKGLVRKNSETKYVQTTEKWYDEVILTWAEESSEGRKKVPSVAEESSVGVAEESSAPIYNNNNINNNIKSTAPIDTPNVKEEESMASPHSKDYETVEANKAKKSYSESAYLLKLDKDDVLWFQQRFPSLDEPTIRKEAANAYYWYKSKGIRRKDYQASLRNWLAKKDNFAPKRGGVLIEE